MKTLTRNFLVGLGGTFLAAGIVASVLLATDADAQTVVVPGEEQAVTAGQAGAFATCARDVWSKAVIANVSDFVAFRGGKKTREDGTSYRPKLAYIWERVESNAEAFRLLFVAGSVVNTGSDSRCDVTKDGDVVSYCIKRGATELTPTQVSCIKDAVEAVIGGVEEVDQVVMRRGPPHTMRADRRETMTDSEFAEACAAGTIECGQE